MLSNLNASFLPLFLPSFLPSFLPPSLSLPFFLKILLELLVFYELDTGLGPGAEEGFPAGAAGGVYSGQPPQGRGHCHCGLPSVPAPPGGGSSAHGEVLGDADSIPRSLASLMGCSSLSTK